MSIKRIESAYAMFMDDERLDGKAMATLLALAYVANEKDGEKCFPSDEYLAKLTHFSTKTMTRSRQLLKDLAIISWENRVFNGRKTTNYYKFLFPFVKMCSCRETYQPQSSLSYKPIDLATHTDRPASTDTQSHPYGLAVPSVRTDSPIRTDTQSHPYGLTVLSVRTDSPINTEYKREINSESKSESKGTIPNFEDIDLGGVLNKVVSPKPKPQYSSTTQALVKSACIICGVDDDANRQTFSRIIDKMDQNDVYEELATFRSEIQQGEHEKLRNPAAELTKRLQNCKRRKS